MFNELTHAIRTSDSGTHLGTVNMAPNQVGFSSHFGNVWHAIILDAWVNQGLASKYVF